MHGIMVRQKDLQIIIFIIGACLLSAFLVYPNGAEGYTDAIGMIWFVFITGIVLVQTYEMKASEGIKGIIIAGFLLRVMFAWAQTYIPHRLPYFMVDGSDQGVFMSTAISYFSGNMSEYHTNFPYLLEKIIHVLGKGELPIRMSEIYLWFLGCILLERTVGKLSGKRHQVLVMLYSLLPWWIYISTAIFRDGLKAFSLMLSLFFLLRWMEYGKGTQAVASIVAAIPAVYMHTADIMMVITVLLVIFIWDVRSQKWFGAGMDIRVFIIPVAILCLPVLYRLIIWISPDYLPASFSIKGIISYIPYDNARTNYVPRVEITGLGQFIYWSLYRIFYFWMSPTIKYWSSIGDAMMFCMDTVPWICMFILVIRGIKSGKADERASVIFIIFLLFSFVYAWGTRNAGTAMRHRDHLIGLFVMAGILFKGEDKSCVG